ncbi:putative NF-X1 finger and helicase domain protein [Aspergillus indologenus CBS 114.80]|uniref:Putative NF-X1 finger and helicase domain protein n=1 Tax=Aspergillus indologenus CBS 114.80 TaxID=1450541 RepID=A0A2V5HVJ0_9EURO|nr:putative NF-X1 finger and helicase domain protein [Aspergillus indologenus CBS 114.80]
MRQSVIQTLSTESGSRCIKKMLDQTFEGLDGFRQKQILRAQVIPFFEVISHPEVLSSPILEQAVGTIYNVLFGRGGASASRLFAYVSDVLNERVKDETTASLLKVTLSVFSQMVELNSEALVQESLRTVAKRFEEIFLSWTSSYSEASLHHQSQVHLERLLRRFEIGSSLPSIVENNSQASAVDHGNFVSKCDPPGGRHDNDHADICQVRIMPSYQEILSTRNEYLPLYDPSQWHVRGLEGLLDRNFRLLREDTIGLLRDAIHSELRPSGQSQKSKSQQRTNVYHDVRILSVEFHSISGVQFEVGFYQPANVASMTATKREEWWKMSKRLQPGALVCLITRTKFVLFCTIVQQQQPENMAQGRGARKQRREKNHLCSLSEDPQVARITVELTDGRNKNIQSLLRQYTEQEPCSALVEFPGVLLPAFEPTLRALQLLKRTANLPLSDLIIPPRPSTSEPNTVSPPLYALKPGFRFDLRCLTNEDRELYVYPDQPADLQTLRQHSSLDDAQATALVDALQRRLGLIQGPPGTGKSYTGVAIIKVLLANKGPDMADLGPILCVTYTNHALDQLLGSLLEGKVTEQIVRIGSRSKAECMEPFQLRTLARKFDKTKFEKTSQWESHRSLEDCARDFKNIELTQRITPARLMHHLCDHHTDHYNQLFGTDEDGFKHQEGKSCKKVLNRWRFSGGKAGTNHVRKVEDLTSVNLTQMSHFERQALYQHWQMEIRSEMEEQLIKVCRSHHTAKRELDNIRSEVDLRCLAQADIVGVTTSGLARNLDMLRRLKSKVVLCEEAGEVLEAHVLTTLLPSVEHTILIGDHLQLRPQVQNYELSRENKNGGEKYALDVSLFERLVDAESPMGANLPFSTLNTQRRMHPSIAQLVRGTLYPQLQGAPSVSAYPGVAGLRKRLFWLDHRVPEADPSIEDATATSKWNDYEVEMATALVSHLLRQGKYRSGDIAVITPYLGQLHKLRRRLGQLYTIALGDRDEDDLNKAGFDDDPTSNCTGVRSTLLESVRVATIDNFQGEEASVVVISLVRSNPQTHCGFLRTPNRINVLLSRAKHGMYIIGNSMTSMHVPMWADVLEMLEENGNIGTRLELQCPRHPESEITVCEPSDFPRLSPEGGCNLRCERRMPCGHACVQKCHSEILHNAVYCLEPCQRPLRGCSHPCPQKCGDQCPPKCMTNVFQKDRQLDCGHLMPNLPCWQSQDLSTVRCAVLLKKTVPGCRHDITVACHVDVTAPHYKCTAQCRTPLPCGHLCKHPCVKCVTRSDTAGTQTDHGICKQECGRNQSTCAHRCKTPCHGSVACPPCQSACDICCGHSRCDKKCSDPCTPCAVEICRSACPHSRCTMPCAAPCDHVPCSKRCDQLLACGHQCPSVCGEICPPARYCQVCGDDEIQNHMVDFILGETYRDINLDENPCVFPHCGHFLTVENMDAQMDMKKYYILDGREKPIGIAASMEPFSMDDIKTCASCRGPLRDIARYGRLVRRALLDESTKRLILYMNREFVPLAQTLPRCIRQLQESTNEQPIVWPTTVKIAGKCEGQLATMCNILSQASKRRWRYILDLRRGIKRYMKQVTPEEQPYSKVRNLVGIARRRKDATESFEPGNDILQLKGSVQATALNLRLDIALLADFLKLHREAPKQTRSAVEMDLSKSRDQCKALVKTAELSNHIVHQTEGYIFLAQLHAFERSYAASPEVIEQHVVHAQEALNHAKTLCTSWPAQTRGMMDEIQGVERMLLGATFYTPVTNDERMAVITAMAQEFRGTGHWYYCRNGHPFTIGECGMAMERAVCPECGEPVGGQNHIAAAGVTRAADLEDSLAGLNLH